MTHIAQVGSESKLFHSWVFKYHLLKPGQKVLEIEAALVLLNIVVAKQHSTYCPKFIEFLNASGKKVMTHDQWVNLTDVFAAYESGQDYDTSGSCIFLNFRIC